MGREAGTVLQLHAQPAPQQQSYTQDVPQGGEEQQYSCARVCLSVAQVSLCTSVLTRSLRGPVCKVQLDFRRPCFAGWVLLLSGIPPACLPRVLSSSAPASDRCSCCPDHQTHMSAVQTLSDLQDCAPEDVAQPTDACQEVSYKRSRPIRIDGCLTGQAHCLLPGRKRSHFQMAVD